MIPLAVVVEGGDKKDLSHSKFAHGREEHHKNYDAI